MSGSQMELPTDTLVPIRLATFANCEHITHTLDIFSQLYYWTANDHSPKVKDII